MARGGRWTCEACGAAWGAAVRYCGTCGAGAVGGQLAGPRRARTGGRARRAAAAVGALVVLGGLAVFASSWPSTAPRLASPQLGPGAEEVALPEPRELPPADGAAGEPEADDRDESGDAAVGPDVDCGGDDCERWRRSFDHPPVYSAWRGDQEVVFVAGGRLVAWDARTGEDRWERPVPSELALGPHELDGGTWRPPYVTGDARWLVVVGPGGVQVLTPSGEERWTSLLPDGGIPILATVAGDLLLVVTEAPAPPLLPTDEDMTDGPAPDPSVEPDEEPPGIHTTELGVVAFELGTGEVRWRRDGSPMVFPPWFHDAAEQEVLLVQEGRATVALDVVDGAERYRLEDADAEEVAHIGGFLVRAAPMAGGDALQVVIHAADDGRELLVLPERAIDAALVVDDLLVVVALASPADDGHAAVAQHEAEAIAVDPAGAIVWRVPLEGRAPASCCASVLDAGQGMVRVAAGPGVAAIYLDVRSGQVERIERIAGSAVRQEWALGRDLVVAHTSSGQQTTVRAARGGHAVTVLGEFAQPVTGADGRGAEDGQLLLQVDAGLVAVELPAPNPS